MPVQPRWREESPGDDEGRRADEGPTVTSPRGEEYRLVGRASPIELEPAPDVLAEAAGQLLVLKEGSIFCCSRPDGDIRGVGASGEGLFDRDTRFLSELTLQVGGRSPLLLSSAAGLAYEASIDLTTPNLGPAEHPSVPQMTLNIRRMRLVLERLYELVQVRNYGTATAATDVAVHLGADFADIFEVRGVQRRRSRGHALEPKLERDLLRFAYVGEDEVFRETLVRFEPGPRSLEPTPSGAVARWAIRLEPGEAAQVLLTVEASSTRPRPRPRSMRAAEGHLRRASREWIETCTSITGLHPMFNRLVEASIRDLRALRTPLDGGSILAAGIPWFVAPFGRDSIIASHEALMVNPDLAREALRFLARHQAREDDPLRDAEPGKILHELRFGELAGAGLVPHTPYYGTVDATPLFLVLAAAHHRWTGDLQTLRELRPALDAALGWIDEHGDLDGDGFIEYRKRSPAGLDNQGWKDAGDAVLHADGSFAEPPITLVEVQGYVYLAKTGIAEVFEALGEPDRAASLRAEAHALRRAFNEAFWMPEEGTFALALDGRGRQVRAVTSNPGHALYCGIVDDDKVPSVAERLMAPDMFSGWGIRTLSRDARAYNPMSYHNGSVWPHDNAIIAAGLKRHGFDEATEVITRALFDAAAVSPELRLPELFCGFARRDPIPYVAYPVASSPQAWAAAAPFLLLQSLLGIEPRASERLLTVNRPHLPGWIGRVELRNLRVGDARLGLAFTNEGAFTSYALVEREGEVSVSISE